MSDQTADRTRTILVVEDEEIVRQMVALVLEQDGFRVLQAASSDEADQIWSAESSSIELLLTDIRLPGMPGPEMARRFKSEKPSLRVIVSSGSDDLETSELMDLITDEDDLLNKPYTPKKLIDATRRQFARSEKQMKAA
jgi:DNA-binding response OmpR family regulator